MQQLLESSDKGKFQVEMGDLNVLLGHKVYQNNNCIQVWGEVATSCIIDALNVVRNRILDFSLAIEKEAPLAGDRSSSETALDQRRITQIFNTTIQGGNMNLVGSADHSTVNQSIQPNDIDAIKDELKRLGIPQEDIESLEEAINSDPRPTEASKLGPKVAAWLGEAIKKAASGVWAIGIGIAGSVLPKLIAKYYGLPE